MTHLEEARSRLNDSPESPSYYDMSNCYMMATGDRAGLIITLDAFEVAIKDLFLRKGVCEEDTRGYHQLHALFTATFGRKDEEDFVASFKEGHLELGEVFVRKGGVGFGQ